MIRQPADPPVLARDHPDFVTALERGLSVLMAFENAPRHMTLTDVSARVGLSRGTARRLLLTLAELGFLAFDGKSFSLTPKVMRLGFGFLASLGLAEAAKPVVEALSAQVKESCSVAVLDGGDLVFVARAEARSVYRASLAVGVRLPAYPTSLGRVLLAGLPDAVLGATLAEMTPNAITPNTIVDIVELRAAILKVRQDGFSIVNEELQVGLRSIAVPIKSRDGRTLAALNFGGVSTQVPLKKLQDDYLPLLKIAAHQIAEACP